MEELRVRVTYTEFLEWLEFLKWEEAKQTRDHFYMAQIAAEIRRGQVKFPRQVRTQDFLIHQPHDGSPTARMKHSKQAWAAHLEIDLKRN